jgi:hypothetical protein
MPAFTAQCRGPKQVARSRRDCGDRAESSLDCKQEEITICCLHDCDPDGYEIARTLKEGTRFNPKHRINVVDFDLFIEDGLAMGLEKERLVMKKKISQKLWSRLSEDQFFVSDAGYTGRIT